MRTLFAMRYSSEHKAQHHENILSVAALSFSDHGGDTSGIGTVMKDLGLTKGGFYRHFESKDDLFAESVNYAFEKRGASLEAIAKAAPDGRGLRAIIEAYLSDAHLCAPGSGCVLFT